MDERRQLPRWQVNRQVKVWLSQMQEFNQCIIEDINLKGMCASFDKQLPQERPVYMSLGLEDDSDIMQLEVNLSWSKEDQGRYVYGLSFIKIAEHDKNKIVHYINANCCYQFKKKWWEGAWRGCDVRDIFYKIYLTFYTPDRYKIDSL